MAHLLFVDDDLAFSPLVKEFLETQGLEVDWHPHSDAGLTAFRQGEYDLCLLDVHMPHKDGFALAREIREQNQEVPIIFLTGLNDKSGKLQGFDLGADDYITKPFSLELLHARIRAVLRRYGRQQVSQEQASGPADFALGGYRFDHRSRVLHHPEGDQKLSAKEAALLSLLVQHRNEVLTREKALKQVWGQDDYYKGMSLNVYISKLRKYLKHEPGIQILNVHGEGYRFTFAEG
jgi:two-component system OmpR family response regulator